MNRGGRIWVIDALFETNKTTQKSGSNLRIKLLPRPEATGKEKTSIERRPPNMIKTLIERGIELNEFENEIYIQLLKYSIRKGIITNMEKPEIIKLLELCVDKGIICERDIIGFLFTYNVIQKENRLKEAENETFI